MTQADETDTERDIADIRRLARTATQAISSIHGKADGANGAVAATVDARGRLEALRLTPQALRLGPDELASEILACVHRAIEQSDAAVQQVSKTFTDEPRIRETVDAMKQFGAEFGSVEPARPAKQANDDEFFESIQDDPLRRRS